MTHCEVADFILLYGDKYFATDVSFIRLFFSQSLRFKPVVYKGYKKCLANV